MQIDARKPFQEEGARFVLADLLPFFCHLRERVSAMRSDGTEFICVHPTYHSEPPNNYEERAG